MERPDFFDVHSHVNDSKYDDDRATVLAELQEAHAWTITVGTDKDMSEKAAKMTLEGEGLFASIGVHPVDRPSEEFDEEFFSGLIKQYPRIVAIGECGLDYYRLEGEAATERARQKTLIERQVAFAVAHNLPLMIHTRDHDGEKGRAHRELIDLFTAKKREYGDALRGNIHFFSGDVDTAKKYFDLDFTISIGGVLTFTHDYDSVVAYAPLERVLSETDAPYVAPVPYRGKRNHPKYVKEVVEKIAEIKGLPVEEVQEAMVANAFRVFQIEKHL